MIWYILYPLRGTTEAPALPSSHPLHTIFTRYGLYAARHVVATLLVSVAVATILTYPIPFLFTSDVINGASNLPRHVWTVAKPLPYDSVMEPDIITRSIWVHASYMQALNVELLTSALELQDELLGITKNFSPALARRMPLVNDGQHGDGLTLTQRDASHVANGLTSQSWFFHSPMLYWSCSRERILADDDIIATINDKKNQSTSANVTLRHSIVFSGKRFEDRRLLAADTLVITLLHLRDSPVGREWEKRALELPKKLGHKWDIYPPDGMAATSRLYEFQFRPISMQDIITLALAYGLTISYLLISLSKLRAVKSKIGLIVTIMAQIILSVMSSFTLCAIFKIDLSRIPRASYPLVVLAMSLEQIFRLINAVILTPMEDSVSHRIGQAFGETAPTALASTAQNVLMLAGLSRLVSPGVSEFCVFAAIAIIFDFFYLSTFFLAVLSVDVRRMELGDALAKASLRRKRKQSDGRVFYRSWWDQVLQGKVAMSTRIAGTVVMFGFVLIAQWHFFDDESLFRKLIRLYKGTDSEQVLRTSTSSSLDNLHQARSPTSWLRMQDHETAREVINIIKPSSHSYVARVHDPVVFVLKNSDRVPHSKEPTLLPALYDFIHHELARFIVVVIIVVAALHLLTNFLLWEDESLKDQHDVDDAPLLSVKSMARGHQMDVVLLTTSADGYVVSIGLDHTIRAWSVKGMGMSYIIAKGDEMATTIFPVIAMTIDDSSTWLVLLSKPKRALHPKISFWSLRNRSWGSSVWASSCTQRPVALFFDPSASYNNPVLLIVQQDGAMSAISAKDSIECSPVPLFPRQLTCARLLTRKVDKSGAGQPVIVAVSRLGDVHMATRSEVGWRSRRLALDGLEDPGLHTIETLPNLNTFVVAAGDRVHLVSADNGSIIQTLQTARMLHRPFKCAYTRHRLSQASSTGLTSFTLAYIEADSGDCILQNFVPSDDCDAIHLQTPCENRSSDWCTWDASKETRKRVSSPGVWDIIADGRAVGIRYKPPSGRSTVMSHRSSGLRNRYARQAPEPEPLEGWEVWTASPGGSNIEGDELQRLIREDEHAEHLLVTELGPKAKVGLNAVAFAFGDMIKLVVVGGQVRFQEKTESTGRSTTATGSRRRKAGTLPRTTRLGAQS
ncbi:hypothetical protein HIM_04987 [Hirsutella minnesotensis 3608]|uniref:SSD domain-containing protein n=1 Tax=Hirsutella minnesotensis 3608 TaxID=1043627 RepID=A0A0F8A5L2_9HYPO|nr:hypothetical protein HIM_04987 [Hirsutella minnesotensis 3608]